MDMSIADSALDPFAGLKIDARHTANDRRGRDYAK